MTFTHVSMSSVGQIISWGRKDMRCCAEIYAYSRSKGTDILLVSVSAITRSFPTFM